MSEPVSGSADNQTDGVSDPSKTNDETRSNPYAKDMFKFKEQAREAQRKAQELEERLKQRELEEEEKKGNLSKVLDEYKEKTRNLETQIKQKDFTFARTNVINSLKQEAIKAGCKDPDAFVRLLGKEKIDIVSFDDSYTPVLDDVKMIVSDGMKQYEHIGLFGRNVNVVNGIPSQGNNFKPTVKPIKEMTTSELIALAKSMN